MTVIQQGSGLTLTIDSDAWDAQTSSVTLTYENTIETYPTLNGNVSVVTDTQGTLEFTAYQDFDEAASLFDALWTAAEAGTAIVCSLDANGATLTFDAIPQFPSAGGAANGALESTVTLVIDGAVVKT
jgi:hypothetical protein